MITFYLKWIKNIVLNIYFLIIKKRNQLIEFPYFIFSCHVWLLIKQKKLLNWIYLNLNLNQKLNLLRFMMNDKTKYKLTRKQQVTSSVVVEIEKNTERHCRSDARSNHQDLQFLILIQIPFSLLIQNPNFLFLPSSVAVSQQFLP